MGRGFIHDIESKFLQLVIGRKAQDFAGFGQGFIGAIGDLHGLLPVFGACCSVFGLLRYVGLRCSVSGFRDKL